LLHHTLVEEEEEEEEEEDEEESCIPFQHWHPERLIVLR
jgi:hypothetical protein